MRKLDKHTSFVIEQVLSVFDGIATSYIVVDSNETIIKYNEISAKLDGVEACHIIGEKMLDAFPSLDRDSSSILRVLSSKKAIWNVPQRYISPTGKVMMLNSSTFPIFSLKNILIAVIEVVHEISDLKLLSDRVIYLSENIKKTIDSTNKIDEIITNDPNFKRIIKELKCFAQTNLPILIVGETGTGKELIAKFAHKKSNISDLEMVTINCAAIPSTLIESTLFGTVKGAFSGAENKTGLFDIANKGTLFLDEINSMPYEVQGKLLRVIQDGQFRAVGSNKITKVSIRFIAAMNEDPIKAIAAMRLRSDLFYRLGVCIVSVPPLRERLNDIPALAKYFIHKNNPFLKTPITGYTSLFIDQLKKEKWPGNIRMLENAILRHMLLCSLKSNDTILTHVEAAALNEPVTNIEIAQNKENKDNSLPMNLEIYEKKLLLEELRIQNWNISKASKELQIPRTTLQSKIRKYKLKNSALYV